MKKICKTLLIILAVLIVLVLGIVTMTGAPTPAELTTNLILMSGVGLFALIHAIALIIRWKTDQA